MWQTFHKFIDKFTQSVSAKHRLSNNHAVFLLTTIAKDKGDMKRTSPFQCYRKPVPEAAAASGDTLQTDDRNINIIEMTENDTIRRGTENEADAISNVTWYMVEYTLSLT